MLCCCRLEGLFAVAPDHDQRQEAADDGAAGEDQDDGQADGPDAGGEQRLRGMRRVDKGLLIVVVVCVSGGGGAAGLFCSGGNVQV